MKLETVQVPREPAICAGKCVGFTGTQHGMTDAQFRRFCHVLHVLKNDGFTKFHHGGCIGADVEAAQVAKWFGYWIVCHPPIKQNKVGIFGSDEYWPPKEYLERDVDIVESADYLIATPKTVEPQIRSGTWYTVRRAQDRHVRMCVILPGGIVKGTN